MGLDVEKEAVQHIGDNVARLKAREGFPLRHSRNIIKGREMAALTG